MRQTPATWAGLRLVARELGRRRGVSARVLLWSGVEAIPTLLSGALVARAIDRIVIGEVASGVVALALLLLASAVGACATRQMFPWLARLVEPVCDALITAVVDGAITTAASADRAADTSGVARLTGQVQAVRNMLFGLLRSVRQVVFTFLSGLVGLLLLAPAVAAMTAGLVALSLAGFVRLLPALLERHRAALLAGEEVVHRTGIALGGLRDAVACGGVDEVVRDISQAVDREGDGIRAVVRAGTARSLILFVGGQMPLVMLLATAPWFVRQGHITVGQVVGAATYLTLSLEPALRSLVGVVGDWGLDLVVHLQRLGEGFRRPEPTVAATHPGPHRYDLAVHALTFSYGEHAEPIVRDLSLTVPEHSHLAVVGASGIGKSTLASLLAGLLRPQRGSVLLGGVDVGDIRESDLRRTLTVIPQEAYVFAGSLWDNVTYLAAGATAQQVQEAAEAVGLQPVVDRLGGMQVQVGTGGAELSQGERQLVALTRVHLSPARVVVLDEATSCLDPMAEARAESAFARRSGTLVVIAHRITSARRADRIMLLDGSEVAIGTHEELLHRSPRYADLVGHWDHEVDPIDASDPARREPAGLKVLRR